MKRVLVVDDEPPIARLISTALDALEIEHTLDYCSDGAQGRTKAARGEHDLIVLDLGMPLMDGVEALSEVKANPKSRDIPVVVLTGMSDPALHARVAELGATAIIMKPCDLDQLGAVLRTALAQEPRLSGDQRGMLRPMGTG